MHPDRDQEWFEKETRNMSRRQIAQELECNFNTSGETVVHPDDLQRIKKKIIEPKYKTGFDRNFWIWEEYSAGNTYLLSADVARGDGADFSTFLIFKLETMEIVAEYQGKIPPDDFSNVIFNAGREFGNCMVVVENNSIGYSVLEKLKDLQYPNVYHSIKSTHEYIDQVVAESKSNAVPGFTNSLKTRPLIIAKLEEFIRNNIVDIYSSRLHNELTTFIWRNGKPEAMKSYNDDLVMACAIGCWVRDTVLIENQRDLAYKKAFLGCITSTQTSLDTTIPGMVKREKNIRLQEKVKEYKEHSWLLKG